MISFFCFLILLGQFLAACCFMQITYPKSVIPAWLKRWLDWARHTELVEVESRRDRNWTSDPFDMAQGCGEHSRTTIKTFGGDALEMNLPSHPATFLGQRFVFSNSFEPSVNTLSLNLKPET